MTTDQARPAAVAVTRMVIGGRPVDAALCGTGEIVIRMSNALRESAITCASNATPTSDAGRSAATGARWPSDRGRLLLRFARVVRDHEDELATKRTVRSASRSAGRAESNREVLEFYAGATTKLRGRPSR
jgi:acyl-CoA reductase-like NAD-dependent aldehyde dehydrogenase